jgi:hypothetical protein
VDILIPIKLELADREFTDRLGLAEADRDPPAPPHEAMPETANITATIKFHITFIPTVLLFIVVFSFQ